MTTRWAGITISRSTGNSWTGWSGPCPAQGPAATTPAGIIGRLLDAVVSGSYLVPSNGAQIPGHEARVAEVRGLYDRTPTPLTLRTREQMAQPLTGPDIVKPGIGSRSARHPDPLGGDRAPWPGMLAGVARKP